MKEAFKAGGCITHICGTDQQRVAPVGTDVTSAMIDTWEAKNGRGHLLIQSFAGELAWGSIEAMPQNDRWAALERYYAKEVGVLATQRAHKAYSSLRYAHGDPMDVFLAKFVTALQRTNAAGVTLMEGKDQLHPKSGPHACSDAKHICPTIPLVAARSQLLSQMAQNVCDQLGLAAEGLDLDEIIQRLSGWDHDRAVRDDGGVGESAEVTYSAQTRSQAPAQKQRSGSAPRQNGRPPVRTGGRMDARNLPNHSRWPNGIDPKDGTFMVGPKRCYKCFGNDGHWSMKCPVPEANQSAARSTALSAYGIALVANKTNAYTTLVQAIHREEDDFVDYEDVYANYVSVGGSFDVFDVANDGPVFALSAISGPVCAFVARTGGSTTEFLFDTGASLSMTDQLSLLQDFVPCKPVLVNGAFGVKGKGMGWGTLTPTFELNGRRTFAKIKNVLFVPSLGVNLIAGLPLMRGGLRVTNDTTAMYWHTSKGVPVAVHPFAGNRMPVNATWAQSKVPTLPAPPEVLVLTTSTTPVARAIWHRRLGHASKARMRELERGMVVGMQIDGNGADCDVSTCESCLAGKAHLGAVTKKSDTVYTTPLEMVSADLWGPSSVASRTGHRYVLCIIDHATRYKWSWLLKTKDEASSRIKSWVALVERETSLKVRNFRTDRGGEFCSKELDQFFASAGIKRQLGIAYAHHQNSVVERQWRTRFNMIRSVMYESGLPLSLWGEASLSFDYIDERLPTTALKGKTPFEAYRGSIPDVSRTRVWGCVAFVHLAPEEQTSKLNQRARRVFFVGYSQTSLGWRFYDPVRKIVIERTHAKFLEGTFGRTRSNEEDAILRTWCGEEDSRRSPVDSIPDPLVDAGSSDLDPLGAIHGDGGIPEPNELPSPTLERDLLLRQEPPESPPRGAREPSGELPTPPRCSLE